MTRKKHENNISFSVGIGLVFSSIFNSTDDSLFYNTSYNFADCKLLTNLKDL